MQIYNAWLKDIPQQFLGKHNIEVLITAFAQQMQEIEQVLEELSTKTDLDNAIGTNLDYVGTIIPLTRKEAGELAGIGVSEPVMSDERYRQFLRYKNLKNTNSCTYYDLINGITLLWKLDKLYYMEDENYPATIIFRTEHLDIEQEDRIEFHSRLCIRSSGVGILLRKIWESKILQVISTRSNLLLHTNVYRKSTLLLNGVWVLNGEYKLNGYQSEKEDINSKLSIKSTIRTEIETRNGLLVERDLWYLNGGYSLNGEKRLDSEVYIEKL